MRATVREVETSFFSEAIPNLQQIAQLFAQSLQKYNRAFSGALRASVAGVNTRSVVRNIAITLDYLNCYELDFGISNLSGYLFQS